MKSKIMNSFQAYSATKPTSQLDELDIAILACVDFHLSKDFRARETVLKQGILQAVTLSLHQHCGMSESLKQVMQRALRIHQEFSDEWHDFEKQGSGVLSLDTATRSLVANKLREVQWKAYVHEHGEGRRLRGNAKLVPFNCSCGSINARAPSIPLGKTMRQSKNRKGRRGRRQNRVRNHTHTIPQQMQMNSTTANVLQVPEGHCGNLKTSQTFMTADRFLESLLAKDEHAVSREELQKLSQMVKTNSDVLKARIVELEEKQAMSVAENARLQIEIDEHEKLKKPGHAEKLLKSLPSLQQNWSNAEQEVERLRAQHPFFNFEKLAKKERNSKEIEEPVQKFEIALSSVLARSAEPPKSHYLEALTKVFPQSVLRHVFGPEIGCNLSHMSAHLCDTEMGLSMLTRSILAATVHEEVFNASFEPLLEGYNTILEHYREEIRKQQGTNTLRGLDFLAHKTWFEKDLLSSTVHQQKADQLAEAFTHRMNTVFENGHDVTILKVWKRESHLVRETFETALELKSKALLSPHLFETRFFPPGTPFVSDRMQCVFPEAHHQHPNNLRKPVVQICTFPGLWSWEYEKPMFDYTGFVAMDDERYRSCENPRGMLRATVLCMEGDDHEAL